MSDVTHARARWQSFGGGGGRGRGCRRRARQSKTVVDGRHYVCLMRPVLQSSIMCSAWPTLPSAVISGKLRRDRCHASLATIETVRVTVTRGELSSDTMSSHASCVSESLCNSSFQSKFITVLIRLLAVMKVELFSIGDRFFIRGEWLMFTSISLLCWCDQL